MKQLYLSLLIFVGGLLCCLQPLHAQDTGHNYVRTRTMLDSLSVRCLDVILYHDGLGRPYLSVQKQQTPSGSNLATLLEYDSLGNESLNWLPAVVHADYLAPSLLKDSLSHFYQGETRPYTEMEYEPSLLSKISRTYHPGSAWQEHPASVEYYANCDSFPLTCIDYTISSAGALISNGTASACKYAVVKSVGEDNEVVYTFTNGLGNEVLVRRMNGAVAYDTYSVYDSYDRLCYVLPPAYQDAPDLNLYAYRYTYDSLGRCVEKKLPGCSPVRYVYDAADHLTFSQDGNQSERSEWTFYLYDAFGRLLVEGDCLNPDTTSVTDIVVQCSVSRNVDRQMTSGYGLWNTSYIPNISLPSASPHVVNYYDDYTFRSLPGFNSGFSYTGEASYAKGKLTGRVGSRNTVYRYNSKGELSDVRSSISIGGDLMSPLRGYKTETYTYTFTGNPQTLVRAYDISGKPVLRESYSYAYDNADRLTDVRYYLGDTSSGLLYRNVYDELGRLSRCDYYHPSDSTAIVTSQGYTYNIRGWLVGISGDKFCQNLYYTDGVGVPCYNGNISSMIWKSGNENTTRGYKYSYDRLSRLTAAVYGESNTLSVNPSRFSEQVTDYDKMGNILGLKRYGQTSASAYDLIDNLSLSYTGNQLKKVTDTASAFNNGFEFTDGADEVMEYEYDKNGNLTKDLNKKITEIQYNYLNLPTSILFDNGDTLLNMYDSNGVKYRASYKVGSVTTIIDYCGNVIYENGVPVKLLTDVGYITLDDNKYHYFIQDHQGNNRVVVDQEGTIEEVNHYYPFGGTFANPTSVQPYKYNGKELNTRNNLNWYDYGARHYDAALGRWHVVDPMAEEYYSWSSYAYCLGNPIKYVDPNGAFTSPYYTANGQFLGVDENGFTGNIYITDEEIFKKYSKNGIANSKDIQGDKKTSLMKDKLLTSAAESHIYTDVLKKSTDSKLDMSRLYKGEVSIVEEVVMKKDGVIGVGYNNPEGHKYAPKYSQSYVEGEIRVTVEKKSNRYDLYTVESIQNYLGIHEYYGHGIMKWSQKNTHWKCYNAQLHHPTFKKLPKYQQDEIKRRNYEYYINRNN